MNKPHTDTSGTFFVLLPATTTTTCLHISRAGAFFQIKLSTKLLQARFPDSLSLSLIGYEVRWGHIIEALCFCYGCSQHIIFLLLWPSFHKHQFLSLTFTLSSFHPPSFLFFLFCPLEYKRDDPALAISNKITCLEGKIQNQKRLEKSGNSPSRQ